MPIPVANFNYTSTGLSVLFTDSSSGVPTSWNWVIKDITGTTVTTSDLSSFTFVFPTPGKYSIILVSSNTSGSSLGYNWDLIVNSTPTLSLSIAEMVSYDIPAPLAVNTPQFRNLVQKWQLYIQPFTQPQGIADGDVFDESKWPPIANVLIAKLVVYDYVMKAAVGAMAAYSATMELFANQPPTISGTIQVADYTTILNPGNEQPNFGGGDTVQVSGMIINGVVSMGSGLFTTWGDLQTWLNSLGFGQFTVDSTNPASVVCKSLGNSNIIISIGIAYMLSSVPSAENCTFTASNVQLSTINQQVIVNGTMPNILQGGVRKMETGPSHTEWFDSSTFWNTMFKSSPGDYKLSTGGSGGIMQNFVKEICSLAARLSIRLPMCPKTRNIDIPIFSVARGGGGCCHTPGVTNPGWWLWDNRRCYNFFFDILY